jgi:SOS response regulatory protein OraA/RecX
MQHNFASALEKALHRLKTSDRFESEIRSYLQDTPAEVVDEVVAHLKAKGLLNDSRTAQQVLRKYSGKRALGRAALVEREVADEFLPSESEERERLWSLLSTRYRPSDDPMKAGRFLYGRGFRADDIESALEKYFGEVQG